MMMNDIQVFSFLLVFLLVLLSFFLYYSLSLSNFSDLCAGKKKKLAMVFALTKFNELEYTMEVLETFGFFLVDSFKSTRLNITTLDHTRPEKPKHSKDVWESLK